MTERNETPTEQMTNAPCVNCGERPAHHGSAGRALICRRQRYYAPTLDHPNAAETIHALRSTVATLTAERDERDARIAEWERRYLTESGTVAMDFDPIGQERKSARQTIATLTDQLREARENTQKQIDYCVKLQWIIEAMCGDRPLPDEGKGLYHYERAAAFIAARDAALAELREAQRNMHPWYGPCDGQREDGGCSECRRIVEWKESGDQMVERLRNERDAALAESARLRETGPVRDESGLVSHPLIDEVIDLCDDCGVTPDPCPKHKAMFDVFCSAFMTPPHPDNGKGE